MSFWLLAFSRSFGFLSVPPVPRLRQLGNRAFFTPLHCLPVATHTLSLSKPNIDLSLYIFPLPHKCRDLGTRTPRGLSAAVVMHFRFLRLKPDARCFVMSRCTLLYVSVSAQTCSVHGLCSPGVHLRSSFSCLKSILRDLL